MHRFFTFCYSSHLYAKRERRDYRNERRRAKKDRQRARGDPDVLTTDSDEEYEELLRPTDDSSSEATSESDNSTDSGNNSATEDLEELHSVSNRLIIPL